MGNTITIEIHKSDIKWVILASFSIIVGYTIFYALIETLFPTLPLNTLQIITAPSAIVFTVGIGGLILAGVFKEYLKPPHPKRERKQSKGGVRWIKELSIW